MSENEQSDDGVDATPGAAGDPLGATFGDGPGDGATQGDFSVDHVVVRDDITMTYDVSRPASGHHHHGAGGEHGADHVLTCAACRVIDRVDGVEDGKLWSPGGVGATVERRFFGLLQRFQGLAADGITTFAGSMRFIYIHIAWFGVWIAINVGLAGMGHEFDKFPFGLLTMIVSLEAIFLSTFVMISQNRQGARADIRNQIDFENNIRSEIWSIHVGQALGLDVDHVEDVVRRAIEGAEAAMRQAQSGQSSGQQPAQSSGK